MNPIKTWLADETGMELSEYAVAAALITLAIIAAFTNLGTAIVERLVDLKGKVKP
ncbi:MAG: Flp family type IVb pilin [Blastocatellia bacterium]